MRTSCSVWNVSSPVASRSDSVFLKLKVGFLPANLSSFCNSRAPRTFPVYSEKEGGKDSGRKRVEEWKGDRKDFLYGSHVYAETVRKTPLTVSPHESSAGFV